MGDHPVLVGKPPVRYRACDTYRTKLISELEKNPPDVVVLSQIRNHKPFGVEGSELARKEVIADSLLRTIKELEVAGIRTIVMSDTPWLEKSVPDCLSAPGYQPGDCASSREEAFSRTDPAELARKKDPTIAAIDLNDLLCDHDRCRPIIDGMIVYKDHHHLTATFARSLADELESALAEYLPAEALATPP